MTLLQVTDISHHFGELQVLDSVGFSVAAGELLCLVGPSGCGKSTLLRLIAGLERLQQGNITLGGEVLANGADNIPARERRIGLVFQQASLFPHLDVRANIGFGLRHLSRLQRGERVDSLLETIGLEDKANAYPHQLSGGQQQRIALARALAPQPRLMLLDEPFANLDHVLRREMREEVLGVLKQAGIPVVMVTHEPEEALMMADRMLLLRADGLVHQYGAPLEVYRHPADADAAAFFGPVNRMAARVREGAIDSVFGRWRQEDFGLSAGDGASLDIITRQESLRLAYEGESGAAATVCGCKAAASGWLVTAELDSGERVDFHMPYVTGMAPATGSKVVLSCDNAYVFAA